jgi:hypothetical protein
MKWQKKFFWHRERRAAARDAQNRALEAMERARENFEKELYDA